MKSSIPSLLNSYIEEFLFDMEILFIYHHKIHKVLWDEYED